MKRFYSFLLIVFFTLQTAITSAQQIKFNKIIKGTTLYSPIQSVAQDKQGFIWSVGYIGGATPAALYRYDGSDFKIYKSDPQKPNTIQNSLPLCMYIDDDNKIWIGHFGGGVDRFDPATGIFTNYRHNKKDASSLSCDTVYAITGDNTGKLWIGTQHGLNTMDKSTGKFTHYFHQANNPKSISNNNVGVLYVDKEGKLWIGCGEGSFSLPTDRSGTGGLNLFHQDTHNFTSYLHDPSDPNTITNNKVSCIYEDSKRNFWVGTQGNNLQTLDRKTGKFTYYPYDPAHPKKLSSFPVDKAFRMAHINFINEDIKGGLWFGLSRGGLYRYDPSTKETTHFGSVYQNDQPVYKDTLSGVKQFLFSYSMNSKDGLFWINGWPPATMYNINFNKTAIPFVSLDANANVNGNAFYQEPGGNILWVGTNTGLIRKDLINKTEKTWSKTNPNGSGWAHDTIGNMTRDSKGILWIATLGGGLCRYDQVANKAFYYMHDKNNPVSICSNMARNLLIDHNGNIWVGTWGQGLDMLDVKSQRFRHYVNSKDSTSLGNNTADYIYEDKDNNIWVGTFGGLNRLNKDGKTFSHYLTNSAVLNIYTDSDRLLWVGGYGGLDYYDKAHDKFLPFIDPSTEERLATVEDILEDAHKTLWIRTTTDIIEINRKNKTSKVFGEAWGVNINNVWISRSLKGKNDELFIGTLGGYYDFFPGDIKDSAPPQINITGFELDSTVNNDKSKLFLNYNTKEIELAHNQNSFVFDFIALHYASPGQEKYIVKLENYDRAWRDLGIEHRLPLFEIPPGKYTLRIKAFNADGAWAEKDIDIIIDPPWWKTWWAYTLFGLAICGAIWGFIQYRSRQLISENKLLEQKVNQRTEELQRSLEELKATQKQLVQSEKMASLGELTAGIAHEIQNPLNFVNNFCEVNTELLDEMQEEMDKGDYEEVKAIAADIKENQLKIHHHGKRADAIVKGMLQHSRTSTGQKEPTDINALADEYLRLSYHGLRAKDKSFNADLKTDFAPGLAKINLIPQDMGRVLLNLFNNAFYAVSEKKKNAGGDYEPVVSVSTAKKGNQLEIRVRDNGNGIPQNVIDKVFQPFFTTKPTGEGTGLGLSITFDIINQVHGGTIAIETEEGKFAEFIIHLPY